MPSSQFGQISLIVWLIKEINPRTMLDIGPGFGKYGFLAREYLELWSRTSEYERHDCRIDAIEVHPPYITPLQRMIYDNVDIGSASEAVPESDTYDLILLIDVLEHLDRPEGLGLIAACLDKGKLLLISTPKNPAPQEPQFGNRYERHISAWNRRDFRSIAPVLFLQEPQSLVALMSHERQRLAGLKSRALFANVYNNVPVFLRRLLSLRLTADTH